MLHPEQLPQPQTVRPRSPAGGSLHAGCPGQTRRKQLRQRRQPAMEASLGRYCSAWAGEGQLPLPVNGRDNWPVLGCCIQLSEVNSFAQKVPKPGGTLEVVVHASTLHPRPESRKGRCCPLLCGASRRGRNVEAGIIQQGWQPRPVIMPAQCIIPVAPRFPRGPRTDPDVRANASGSSLGSRCRA